MPIPRSQKLWFDARPIGPLSDGSMPVKDVFACPSDYQVHDATDEAEAARLVEYLNAAAYLALGS